MYICQPQQFYLPKLRDKFKNDTINTAIRRKNVLNLFRNRKLNRRDHLKDKGVIGMTVW
jgi:hypothetical protein